MKSQLVLANILRWLARVMSIPLILIMVIYLPFVGLQVLSGEPGFFGLYLYLLLLITMLAGLVIAWWKEGLGATISLVSLIGSFALSGLVLPGVGPSQGFSLLVGPLNLLFALLLPGYHPEVSPSAKLVPVLSWALPTVPLMLFFASWWLRRKNV